MSTRSSGTACRSTGRAAGTSSTPRFTSGPTPPSPPSLPAFNAYLERVSALLRLGRTESRLAVYLPNEDNRRLDRIPEAERTPGAVYRWEMRHVVVPREAEGYAPLWVSPAFLRRAEVVGGRLRIGDCDFSALLIDVEWLDGDALAEVVRLAEAGLPVILRALPRPAREAPRDDYVPCSTLSGPARMSSASSDDAGLAPLVAGDDLPPFWARRTAESLYLFFAHPKARELRYPMRYGQSLCRERTVCRITIDFDGLRLSADLVFEPYQSLLVPSLEPRACDSWTSDTDRRSQPATHGHHGNNPASARN